MKASTRDGHKQTTNHCIFLQCFTKVKNLFFQGREPSHCIVNKSASELDHR